MNQVKSKFLSKDEEIDLGKLVKRKNDALRILGNNDNLSRVEKVHLKNDVRIGREAEEKISYNYKNMIAKSAYNFSVNKTSAVVDYDDYEQDGFLGFYRGIYKYEPDMGNKISTYVSPWIQQSINRSNNIVSRTIRLPENKINQVNKIKNVINAYSLDNLSEKERMDVIRKETGYDEDTINAILYYSQPIASLNYVVNSEDSSHVEYQDILDFKDDNNKSSEETFMKDYGVGLLYSILDELDERDKELVCSYYQINGDKDEILDKYNIDKKFYKREVNKSLVKLKEIFNEKSFGFDDFIEVV